MKPKYNETGKLKHRQALAVMLPLLLAYTVSTPQLSAQEIVGEVVNAGNGSRLEGVIIYLVNSDHEVVQGRASRANGTFALAAPHPGQYTLQAERLGYGPISTEPFTLREGETKSVRLTMFVEAIRLSPIAVVTDRRNEPVLERHGFYEREELYGEKIGGSTFLGPGDIERRKPWKVTDLLRDIPGIRVVSQGGRAQNVLTRNGRYIPVYLDGREVGLRGETINDLINVASVGAVEVYTFISPAEYGGGPAIALWTRVW